ncbi:MAG: aromatic ring-hydroxylating dioxygenase subunit alpha [Steroidobacteraceae bacterium]
MSNAPVSGRRLVNIDQNARRFRVHRDAYRSEEVFQEEMERVFEKCWLYVGHKTEIPEKGDFVRRQIAGRDVIFVRSREGTPNAFLNTCLHRGALVCRDKRGTAKTFSCPYHGWVYNTEGKLLSMNAQSGFPENINADGALNLKRVPRLEHYRGFYFLNFDANAISLADYLAGAKDFLDLMCDQGEGSDVTVVKGEHSYAINANYKFLCENSYDGYHLLPTHVSYLEFLDDQSKLSGKESALSFLVNEYSKLGEARGLGNGHGSLESWVASGRPVAQWIPSWGADLKQEIDATRARLVQRFGEQRAARIADLQKNMVIFPNLVINDNVGFTVRVIEPISATRMRVNAWALAPVDESPRMLALRLDNFVGFLGPAGFGSSDDVEMLELCQRGLKHRAVEWNEISKGMKPGDSRLEVCGSTDEGHMRAYWAQWDLLMRGQDAFGQSSQSAA